VAFATFTAPCNLTMKKRRRHSSGVDRIECDTDPNR